jgi:hypothetical protein
LVSSLVSIRRRSGAPGHFGGQFGGQAAAAAPDSIRRSSGGGPSPWASHKESCAALAVESLARELFVNRKRSRFIRRNNIRPGTLAEQAVKANPEKSNVEIARNLGISPSTVSRARDLLFGKRR